MIEIHHNVQRKESWQVERKEPQEHAEHSGKSDDRSHEMIRFNKGKLINGQNLPIMGKIHHSKECGHHRFHGMNIITPKE